MSARPRPAPAAHPRPRKPRATPTRSRPAAAVPEPDPPPLTLDTPLADPRVLGRLRARGPAVLGITTAGGLLVHFPRRHEDRTRFDAFPAGETERAMCVSGVVGATVWRRFGRNRIFEATLHAELPATGALVLRWFGLRFIHKLMATGDRLIVYGRVRLRGKRLCIEHPEFEKVDREDPDPIHVDRLTPVHPAGGGASVRSLRGAVHRTLEALGGIEIPDVLPASAGGMPRAQALRAIHFPGSDDALARARETLVLEEFFVLQLVLASRRARREADAGSNHRGRGRLAARLHAGLPFALTSAQVRAVAQIRADLAAPRPMHRLLQGDVGSGKTLVALTAMLDAVESGAQAVLMAPTQILAEQHHRTITALAGPLGVRVALRTGGRKVGSGPDGGPIPHLLVGTHALLHDDAGIERLGLVVIDEQHKFGVMQRAQLRRKGAAPDVLVMTATPIPRTLAMSLFGDLDVSEIDELPPGRGTVRTVVREHAKLEEAVAFLRDRLARGRQAYIVYPVIDATARTELKAAAAEFERWSARLAPMPVGLLHGRLPPEAREAVLGDFRAGRIAALISTTVIEVGIDVPNATLLLVENAERFGLAQLHQLRGRIGRGAHASHCILLAGEGAEENVERLRVLERTRDGFAIAEEDLRLRGAGDLLGTAQSGLPPLRIGDLARDAALMRRARDLARGLIDADPGLILPENQRLRPWVVEPMTPDMSQTA
jgi:ATP-dependent DNA helicase RecG